MGRDAGLGLRGPGGARPPRHATTAAAVVFVQLALRWGRNWAAQWHMARAVGKRFQGCHAKRLYVNNRGPGAVPGGVASKNGYSRGIQSFTATKHTGSEGTRDMLSKNKKRTRNKLIFQHMTGVRTLDLVLTNRCLYH